MLSIGLPRLLGFSLFISFCPVFQVRAASLQCTATIDQAGVAQAQQRDDSATRAYTSIQIRNANGQCLFVNQFCGDQIENTIPIQAGTCDSSDDSQKWDVITAGVHNDFPGYALIVSDLTNGCLTYDTDSSKEFQVYLFSCGGRTDGNGATDTAQLFPYTGGTGPLAFAPQTGKNTVCLTLSDSLMVPTSCDPSSPSGNELFTLENSASASSSNSGGSSSGSSSGSNSGGSNGSNPGGSSGSNSGGSGSSSGSDSVRTADPGTTSTAGSSNSPSVTNTGSSGKISSTAPVTQINASASVHTSLVNGATVVLTTTAGPLANTEPAVVGTSKNNHAKTVLAAVFSTLAGLFLAFLFGWFILWRRRRNRSTDSASKIRLKEGQPTPFIETVPTRERRLSTIKPPPLGSPVPDCSWPRHPALPSSTAETHTSTMTSTSTDPPTNSGSVTARSSELYAHIRNLQVEVERLRNQQQSPNVTSPAEHPTSDAGMIALVHDLQMEVEMLRDQQREMLWEMSAIPPPQYRSERQSGPQGVIPATPPPPPTPLASSIPITPGQGTVGRN